MQKLEICIFSPILPTLVSYEALVRGVPLRPME